MSDLDLIDLWRELKKHGGQTPPANSPLITNCEQELSELMRQIDIMFRNKRMDWCNEKAVINMKLDSREKECALQQESLDMKNKEIGQLREQLVQIERGDKSLVGDYQKQVEQLHKDLSTLKKQYEKMRNKHNKEKLKLSAEKLETESENWSKDKRLMQQEIDKLSMQMKSLVEKCELLEHQGGNYQDQLAKRKQLLGDIEVNLRSELHQLRRELHDTEDREAEKSVEIARLKADLSHWKNKTSKITKDMQTTENALKKANAEVNYLKSQTDGLNRELKTQGSALNMAATDQSEQEKEIHKLKDILKEKNISIQTLLDRNHLDESAALETLKSDLLKVDEQNRTLRKVEIELRGELMRLRSEIEQLNMRMKATDDECMKLSEKLHNRNQDIRDREMSDIKIRDNELSDLQSRMHDLRDSHSVEVASLKNELDSVRRQLCDAIRVRPPAILTTSLFTEDTSRATSPTNTITEEPAEYVSELRITQKQLEAVRLENKHLREQVLTADTQPIELSHNNHYGRCMDKLEQDNGKLKIEVNKMRAELQSVQETHHKKYQALLREMQRDIASREDRLKEEQAAELERHKWSNDSRLDLKESGYRSALNALSAEKEVLKERLDRTEEELERSRQGRQTLVEENAAMASFAGNIGELCATSSMQDTTLMSNDQTSEFLNISADPVRRLTYRRSTPRSPSPTHSTSTKKSYSVKSHSPQDRHHSKSPRDSHNSSRSHRSRRSHHQSRRSLDEPHSSPKEKTRLVEALEDQSCGDKSSVKSHGSSEKRRSTRRTSSRRSHGDRPTTGTSSHTHDRSYGYTTSCSGQSVTDGSLLDLDESIISSQTESAAENFLGTQKHRTTALEQLLDKHLKDLRLDGQTSLNSTMDYLKSFS